MTLGPEGGQALRRERRHELAEGRDSPPPRCLDLLLAPAPGDPRGGPDQSHGEEVLPEAVVDGVEQPVAGHSPALGQDTLLDQGLVQHLARSVCQQRAVEVDEDSTLGHGGQPKTVSPGCEGGLRGFRPRSDTAGSPAPASSTAAGKSPELGEGIAGGEGDPFSRLTRVGGGASDSLWSAIHFVGVSAISQAVVRDTSYHLY